MDFHTRKVCPPPITDNNQILLFLKAGEGVYDHPCSIPGSNRKISGVTDAELNERLGTLPCTLCCKPLCERHINGENIFYFRVRFWVFLRNEIASRRPGLPPEEIEVVKAGYEVESWDMLNVLSPWSRTMHILPGRLMPYHSCSIRRKTRTCSSTPLWKVNQLLGTTATELEPENQE